MPALNQQQPRLLRGRGGWQEPLRCRFTTQAIMKSFILLIIAILVVGCRRDQPSLQIPDKKSEFQKQVFTDPQNNWCITLISPTECEVQEGKDIILSEYSRDGGRLRLVTKVFGTTAVRYFNITTEGLQCSDTGHTYLLPEPHARERARMQTEQEATVKAAMAAFAEGQRRSERERQIEMARRQKEAEDTSDGR